MISKIANNGTDHSNLGLTNGPLFLNPPSAMELLGWSFDLGERALKWFKFDKCVEISYRQPRMFDGYSVSEKKKAVAFQPFADIADCFNFYRPCVCGVLYP